MSKEKDSGNFLDLVPVRNCRWDKTGDGKVFFLVPRFKNRLLKSIALKLGKSEFVRVYLDDKGARVWELVDDARSVGEIGGLLEKENKEINETGQQAYERLSQFIAILARNRFIRLRNP